MIAALGVDWSQLSVGVAAIVGLVYVVRTMERMAKNNNDGTAKMASAVQEVSVGLNDVSNKMDVLHDDNVESRAALLYADKTIVRKTEEQNMTAMTRRLDRIEQAMRKGASAEEAVGDEFEERPGV